MNQRRRWEKLNERIVNCTRCERLVEHCQHIAAVKRKSFRDWEYWGRAVANGSGRRKKGHSF